MIIDTHAHYDHRQFDRDRHDILSNLPTNGVEFIINVGCDLKTIRASVKFAKIYSHVYASVGVHPHYVKDLSEEAFGEVCELAKNERVVAYGETGLDFFHNFSPPDIQRQWFKKQLAFAHKLGKPLIIHSRDANDEVFQTISDSPVRHGVIHSFSGDAALAERYVEMGFYIGIGGVVTFPKARTLKDAVAAVPLSHIILETDCPYLTPEPHRGKRNDSTHLIFVAEEIAKIKKIPYDDVCRQTTMNAKKLFNLS